MARTASMLSKVARPPALQPPTTTSVAEARPCLRANKTASWLWRWSQGDLLAKIKDNCVAYAGQ
jgi:hypothetical protein